MNGNGFSVLYSLEHPRATSSRSLTNSMYWGSGVSERRDCQQKVAAFYLCHLCRVHSKQSDRERFGEEFLFNRYRFRDNAGHHIGRRLVLELTEHVARKIGVQSLCRCGERPIEITADHTWAHLIAGDQLVRKRESWQLALCFDPEDCCKRAAEENACGASDFGRGSSEGRQYLYLQRMQRQPAARRGSWSRRRSTS